jgi:thiol-disulfide isomerase/thioredoxin
MRSARIVPVLALIFFLAACATSRPDKGPRVGANKLTFSLPDLAGNTISSSDDRFAGKVVMVTLWGSWCPPCVSEIPTFNDIQKRLGPDGLEVVAIAFEKETDAAIRVDHLRAFSAKHQINYLVLDGGSTSDFSTALPMVDDVEGFPVEILVDRNGVVVDARNGYGYSEKWALGLENRLNDLLAD